MSQTATRVIEEKDFKLPSGKIHAEVSGNPEAPLVIGVPGLSANLRSFDAIFGAMDPERHRFLAYDPRGRGRSEKTAPGTYGWPGHARDIAAMADELGAQQFDLVGWSFGTWVSMQVCKDFPGRVRKLVLIDGGGAVDEEAKPPIYAGLDRLATVWPSRQGFIDLVKQLPNYQPWNPAWERLFEYELEDVEGGVRARTQKEAPLEDEEYRKNNYSEELWKAATMPTLLLRAEQEIMPGMKYILNGEQAAKMVEAMPSARLITIDANHYVIGMHPDCGKAIAEFLES